MLAVGSTVTMTVVRIQRTSALGMYQGKRLMMPANEFADIKGGHLGDYLLERSSFPVVVVSHDEERGFYVVSHLKVPGPHLADRIRPLATRGGFEKLKRQTEAMARRAAGPSHGGGRH